MNKRLIKEVLHNYFLNESVDKNSILTINVLSDITIWNTRHGLDRMLYRPTCKEQPNYKGCYSEDEDSRPIPEDVVINILNKRGGTIINEINRRYFQTFRQNDNIQHTGLIEDNKIFILLTLLETNYPGEKIEIDPFRYTIRVESARRSNGKFYRNKGTAMIGRVNLNELVVNSEDRSKILYEYQGVIKTTFNIIIVPKISELYVKGESEDRIIKSSEELMEVIKEIIPIVVRQQKNNKENQTFTHNKTGLTIDYIIKRKKETNYPTIYNFIVKTVKDSVQEQNMTK